jgi:zinc/manganese transport system substrate-binding protein
MWWLSCWVQARRLPLSQKRAAVVAALLLLAGTVFAGGAHEGAAAAGSAGAISVVAAENEYGDVAAQIGGTHVAVTSIMNDPNVDPHEYESSVNDAKAVANAALVIENGGGYDDWMDKLLSSSPDESRILINAFSLAPTKLSENVHVFYNVDNMEAVASAVRDALTKLDQSHAADFAANFAAFSASLSPVRTKMAEIKAKYAHAPVAVTETIFLYQAAPMGLDVMTPVAFQKAIAEGNDPPADSALTAERQITAGKVRALIVNEQTVTKITTRLQDEAKAAGIPIVAVTETMPPGLHYQSWMVGQLDALEKALAAHAGG